ncbi:hypothetical protein EJ05DRAFT_129265 [Pseudovirgaria hyperparasitica]|uniref:Membrane-associated, eicosanoid/glutathione metabolism (MAPEG) protein n=1 Tax=Pseudovirgaria hyperparasitica TaxID=470096 RepID=A0A6A6VXX9_9PEZI|nr:uncharacterized protein EJ05DRAFT_129265 [Pseudovirgaria hyperparasitica]KAF2754666.1 hypothetical protein EJ05DRAFT_129265 [Pseudovirgaria hyperparasitica]
MSSEGFFAALAAGNVNLSIASLPLTLLLAALPHWYSIYKAESSKVQGGWTNQNPRAFVARLNARAASGKKLSDVEELILRGQAAQQNGFEHWAIWAVAVVFGHLAKIPKADMDRYTTIHIVSRVLFYYFYLTMGTRRSSYLRTAVFQATLYPAIAVFLHAARVVPA